MIRPTPRVWGARTTRLVASGLFVALMCLASRPASSGLPVQVCVEPADTTVALGDFVTVRVTTDGPAADLKGYLFRTTYNPTVLAHLSTTPGGVLTGFPFTFIPASLPPDTLGFDAAVLIGATDGPGTLGYFQFQAVAPGICDFHPVEVLMRDSLNQPFPIVTCSGRVRVISVTPTVFTQWGIIKARHADR